MFFRLNPLSISRVCVMAVAVVAAPVWAAEPVLLQGPKLSITAQDIAADAERIPLDARANALSQPQTIHQIASNLYVRRAMAAKAETEGLAKDPKVAAALKLAQDKVLSDALLAKIDRESAPTEAVAEGQARNTYVANPERFKVGEQVRIRHILVTGDSAESRAKAEKLLAELKAGADFAKLAKENSDDRGSAPKGGELGFFTKGRMVPEFEEKAFAMKTPGEIAGPVQTKFGFHILQLQETKPAGVRSFDEVRAELVTEVRATITRDARVAEAQRLLADAKPDENAIKAVAATYAPSTAPKAATKP